MQTDPENATAEEMLTYVMRRRGWNPSRLSELTRGQVSASSIRAYEKGHSRPRPRAALAIANAIGPEKGGDLLTAWGYPEMAAGFLDEWREEIMGTNERLVNQVAATFRVNRIEYSGAPLSENAITNITRIIHWFQALEEEARRPR